MGLFNRADCKAKTPSFVDSILKSKREYPLVDTIVLIYVAVVFLVQILFQISPVMTFLASTPFYSMQAYLGVLGGALIVLDLFTTKRIWQGKYSLFLYAILVVAALASVRMISYGVKENLFKLCWTAIQFVLVYSCTYRVDREIFKKYLRIYFYVLFGIWFVACCISVYQYINQIGYVYVVNPLAMDTSANRQGFFDNRLFGIFYTLNHAAYVTLLFLITGFFCILKEKKIFVKVMIAVAEVVLLCHLILSYSRSAQISFMVCVLIVTWCLTRNANKASSKVSKVVLPIIVSAVITVGALLGWNLSKTTLSYVPYLHEKLTYSEQSSTSNSSETSSTNSSESMGSSNASTSSDGNEGQQSKPEYNDSILDREGLEDDVSNGRFQIWKDYASLYKQIGLVGLSPGNYMPYVMENHSDLFIVEDIRVNYPSKFESGIIYHGHSGYVNVFIGTGFLGILSLIIFAILCIVFVFATIARTKKLSFLFICSFCIVVAGAISAVLDEGLFFQNTPHTTLFWFALGILMNPLISKKKTEQESNS